MLTLLPAQEAQDAAVRKLGLKQQELDALRQENEARAQSLRDEFEVRACAARGVRASSEQAVCRRLRR